MLKKAIILTIILNLISLKLEKHSEKSQKLQKSLKRVNNSPIQKKTEKNLKKAKKTISLFILSRHGHRYSLAKGEKEKLKGQLSTIGLRTNYLLGKYIRKKYSNFFPENFKSSKNEIITSGLNRNKMSGSSFFLGLYDLGSFSKKIKVEKQFFSPEFKNFVFDNNFETALPKGFQPVPIFSFLKKDNFWFEGWNDDLCPRLRKSYEIGNSEQKRIVVKKMEDLIPILENEKINIEDIIGKKKIYNVDDVNMIYDFIFSESYLGKINLDANLLEKINILGTLANISSIFNNRDVMKYEFTLFIRKILENLQKGIDGDKTNQDDFVNFTYLNGHDTNLLTFLALMDYTSFDCLLNKYENSEISNNFDFGELKYKNCLSNPKYSSAFVFELFKENNKYYVNLSLNGKNINLCNVENCTFEDFSLKMNEFALEGDFEDLKYTYCLDDYRLLKNHGVTIFFLFVNLILIGIVGYVIYKKNKEGNVF